MKAPIIVEERGGDMTFFDSVTKAEQSLEAIDVENGEYVVYDSEGRLLELRTISKKRVVIQPAEAEPMHANELSTKLIRCFSRMGFSAGNFDHATLEMLIGKGNTLLHEKSSLPKWGLPVVWAAIFLLFAVFGIAIWRVLS